ISRARGLSGRESLNEGEGLLFLFDGFGNYGIWMKDMKFAIDIVWIKNDRVVGFAENVAPEPGKELWSLKLHYPPEPVDKVLEFNAGSVQRSGIKIGDRFSYY
ncbi:MAG: DUF192 domain-containing protein, partial [bacterium]|nr:DUF192 domain-containing protein [bacterium]